MLSSSPAHSCSNSFNHLLRPIPSSTFWQLPLPSTVVQQYIHLTACLLPVLGVHTGGGSYGSKSTLHAHHCTVLALVRRLWCGHAARAAAMGVVGRECAAGDEAHCKWLPRVQRGGSGTWHWHLWPGAAAPLLSLSHIPAMPLTPYTTLPLPSTGVAHVPSTSCRHCCRNCAATVLLCDVLGAHVASCCYPATPLHCLQQPGVLLAMPAALKYHPPCRLQHWQGSGCGGRGERGALASSLGGCAAAALVTPPSGAPSLPPS